MPRLPRAFPSPSRSPISRATLECLLVELDGVFSLTEALIGNAEIAESNSFAASIADLA